MRLRYQHPNPHAGNESHLLRFHDEMADREYCLLVDAGAGTDVKSLLGPDDHLAGVLLTHAHLDHYEALARNVVDRAPVYASPPTAGILETVLTEATANYDVGDPERVLDALEPIDDWTQIVDGVHACPVPAGHVPGACGFLVQAEVGDGAKRILATGDFTTTRAGGYPGFDPESVVDTDVVLLNGATSERYRRDLTESVRCILERSRDGSAVLATASGLTGVQYAYLLGHLGDRFRHAPAVRVVGHLAKLYGDLDYDVPNVDATETFDDPGELVEPGVVVLAGPEVPVEGSAGRLFGTIRDDPGATLVQLTGGGTEPVTSAGCTVADFDIVAHPTRETVDEVVEALDPVHLVVGHQRGRALETFRDNYSSYVWAGDEQDVRELYDGEQWTPPPWMTERGKQFVERGNRRGRARQVGDAAADVRLSLPGVSRAGEVDFEAEGLDLAALDEQFQRPPADSTADDAAETAAGTNAGTDAQGGDDGGRPGASERAESPTTVADHADPASEATGDHADPASGGGSGDDPGTGAAARWTELFDRLDAIQASVEPATVLRAEVAARDDGALLLRLDRSDLPAELSASLDTGTEVAIGIRRSVDDSGPDA